MTTASTLLRGVVDDDADPPRQEARQGARAAAPCAAQRRPLGKAAGLRSLGPTEEAVSPNTARGVAPTGSLKARIFGGAAPPRPSATRSPKEGRPGSSTRPTRRTGHAADGRRWLLLAKEDARPCLLTGDAAGGGAARRSKMTTGISGRRAASHCNVVKIQRHRLPSPVPSIERIHEHRAHRPAASSAPTAQTTTRTQSVRPDDRRLSRAAAEATTVHTIGRLAPASAHGHEQQAGGTAATRSGRGTGHTPTTNPPTIVDVLGALPAVLESPSDRRPVGADQHRRADGACGDRLELAHGDRRPGFRVRRRGAARREQRQARSRAGPASTALVPRVGDPPAEVGVHLGLDRAHRAPGRRIGPALLSASDDARPRTCRAAPAGPAGSTQPSFPPRSLPSCSASVEPGPAAGVTWCAASPVRNTSPRQALGDPDREVKRLSARAARRRRGDARAPGGMAARATSSLGGLAVGALAGRLPTSQRSAAPAGTRRPLRTGRREMHVALRADDVPAGRGTRR